MADEPRVPVLIVGDFNMVMNTQVNRFPFGKRFEQTPYTLLYRTGKETGLRDIWRQRHEGIQGFSYYSGTHSSLSRIDMAIGNDILCTLVTDIKYEARGLSDHSPLVLGMETWGGRRE